MTLALINIADLADRLGIAKGTIHKHLSGVRRSPILSGLPEPCARRGKMVWVTQDVDGWLDSLRTFRPIPAPDPQPLARRGRPRKAAREGGAK
jgi:hypothetical protein